MAIITTPSWNGHHYQHHIKWPSLQSHHQMAIITIPSSMANITISLMAIKWPPLLSYHQWALSPPIINGHNYHLIISGHHCHLIINGHHYHLMQTLEISVLKTGIYCSQLYQILQNTEMLQFSALSEKNSGKFCKFHDIFKKWGNNIEISANCVLSSFIKYCKFCTQASYLH